MSLPPDLVIREAVAEDLPALIALLADDPLGRQRETTFDDADSAYRTAFLSIQADPNEQLWVIAGDDGPVAQLQLGFIPGLTYEGGTRAQIEGVRVARERRGEGLGRLLFEHAIERARQHGCRLVQLTSDRRRPEALAFYEALGFEASHVGFKLHL